MSIFVTLNLKNILMQAFLSCHYVGKDLIMKFEKGEPWKKVFGPIPVYLNSVSDDTDYRHSLWEDAKKQVYIKLSLSTYGN